MSLSTILQETCDICKRKLSNPDDVLSENIAGTCSACMLQAECDVKDYRTALSILSGIQTQLLDKLRNK